LLDSQLDRAAYFLQDAIDEARRIDKSDPDCVFALTAVSAELVSTDRSRAWVLLSEAVNAANSSEDFVGDDVRQPKPSMVATRRFTKFIRLPADDFKLGNVLSPLAMDELERSVELVKAFKYDAPRANATSPANAASSAPAMIISSAWSTRNARAALSIAGRSRATTIAGISFEKSFR
jgi:hypothetical protein